jgi:hypothetical protein
MSLVTFWKRARRSLLLQGRMDPAMFSGHSFRRGGATFAHRKSVSPLLIVVDWSSDAYMAYIDQATPEDLARLPRALARASAAMA